MATTPKGFPYPVNTDPVNVPSDMGALATAIDSYFDTALVDLKALIVMGAL